jgi:hypothetical protein
MRPTETRMDCGECGQNIAIRERHTFVDCALYVAEHTGEYAPRCCLKAKYAQALAAEVRRLREAHPDAPRREP